MTQIRRVRADVFGTVQGVGFRPFVSRLAARYDLSGSIRNTARGVTLELEGDADALEDFFCALQKDAPPLSQIRRIEKTQIPPTGQRGFLIEQSRADAQVDTLIPPDAATCDRCVRELLDPSDRRYRCAFINCTDCGPRFTIIRGIPYDRAQSAMAAFSMCESCAEEFCDVTSRRYHAQPVCCNDCGPHLWFSDQTGRPMAGDAIRIAQRALANGQILAVKGVGGFHLCCKTDEESVLRLRSAKHRDEKPLALLVRDLVAARRFCRIDKVQEQLLTSFRRPIVLCEKKDAKAFLHLSENAYLGLMLPYAPIHHLLFDGAVFDALIMTSANESDMPITADNGEALATLRNICDGFLLHDRLIDNRCDDSLVYAHRDRAYFVRRSRGYVPQPIANAALQTPILACGAEQKASFCLSVNGRALLSAHIGDLKNLETLAHYESQATHFEKLFSVAPQAIVCDKHPDYLSTRYAAQRAKKEDIPLFFAQHHHAHMVSCMADNQLAGNVIGVVFDGAGLGDDGTIWGGEFLFGDAAHFTRMGRIRPFPLCGGDAAAKEPLRAAAGLLFSCGISPKDVLPDLAAWQVLLAKNINCPMTSSVGRLFDAVAGLLGVCAYNTYESRAAMLLQTCAMAAKTSAHYPARIVEKGMEADGLLSLDTAPLVHGILRDLAKSVPADAIAQGFHRFLCEGTRLVCRAIRERTHCDRVVLSGGVFLNLHLLSQIEQTLAADGFAVYTHQNVSCSDEGLSLGQALIAQHALSKKYK